MSTPARRSTRLSAPQPAISSTSTAHTLSAAKTDSSDAGLNAPKTTKKRTRKPAASTVVSAPTPAATDDVLRCWKTEKPDSVDYHDGRWGNTAYFFPPTLADTGTAEYRESLRRLFLMQSLELMQAGLSWSCIMGKWAGFERAFEEFDVDKVSQYDEKDVERLLNDPDIVRNRLKVQAVIQNARTIRQLQDETPHGFLHLLFQHHLPHSPHRIHTHERILPTGRHQPSWMRTDYRTASYKDRTVTDGVHPSISVVELSKDLKRAGFRFMGETVVLSYMQAIGLMNHHARDCGWFQQCEDGYEKVRRMFVEDAEERKKRQEEGGGGGEEVDAKANEVEAEESKRTPPEPAAALKQKTSARGKKRRPTPDKSETKEDAAEDGTAEGDEATNGEHTTAPTPASRSRSKRRQAVSEQGKDRAQQENKSHTPTAASGGRRRKQARATEG